MAITSPGTAVFGTFGTEVAAILALPSGKLTKNYGKSPFIVNVPMKNGDFL